MSNMIKINTKKSKIRLLHQYYSYTGFYSFVKESMKKAITPIILLIVAIVLIDRYLIDFSALFTLITNTYSPVKIFALFLRRNHF